MTQTGTSVRTQELTSSLSATLIPVSYFASIENILDPFREKSKLQAFRLLPLYTTWLRLGSTTQLCGQRKCFQNLVNLIYYLLKEIIELSSTQAFFPVAVHFPSIPPAMTTYAGEFVKQYSSQC